MQLNTQQQRQLLLSLWHTALSAVHGEPVVKKHITTHMPDFQGSLIAIGKAASAMARGAYACLGNKIHQGLVITKYGHGDDLPCPVLEAGHPIPDDNSLQAGQALLDFIKHLPPHEPLLLLLSGGTSSLVEVLDESHDLASLQAFTRQCLSQTMDIQAFNQKRRQFSKIKHGGLLNYLGKRPVTQLLISDVLNNAVETIGSGLLYCPQSSVNTHIIADLGAALDAAELRAKHLSLPVYRYTNPVSMTVEQTADYFHQELLGGNTGIYLWSGEITLKLPKFPGRGGRNQHLALLMAEKLSGTNTVFLAAGSDGDDGNSQDAGALIDGDSWRRGQLAGEDLRRCLANADSHRFITASGDAIYTGPTGTNVADLYFSCQFPETQNA